MKKITLVLADDHKVLREGLKALLQAEEDFEVLGEAGNGMEACRLVEHLKPDVLVLDLMMPDMNGLEVTRVAKKRSSGTHVVILSMYGSEGYVIEALRAGAQAYVLKESSSTELAQAIRAVASGHRYLSPPLSERAIDVYTQSTEKATLDPYETLTTREREVLHMAAQGYTNSEIAKQLFISQRTAEVHRTNMMRKLSLHSQTDLIRYALKREILPKETP